MSYNTVILLLGSNLNQPEKNIQTALEKLESKIGTILRKSEILITEPLEFDSLNNFCNIAVNLKTQISPFRLLSELKSIEREMGRVLDSAYYGAYQDRIIDIDIILYNDINFISRHLVIPHHKNLYEREFAREIIDYVKQTI